MTQLDLHWSQLSPSPLNKQVRGDISDDSADLQELASNIDEIGLIQPLTVVETPDGPTPYQVLTGERRWRAARLLGDQAPLLPCVVRAPMDTLDQLIVMGAENLQRSNLDPITEARYYRTLQDHGLDPAAIARKTGKPRHRINSRLRLLDLAPIVQSHIKAGRIPLNAERHLSHLSPDLQAEVATKMIGRSVVDIKRVINLIQKRSKSPSPNGKKAEDKFDPKQLTTTLVAIIHHNAQLLARCADSLAISDFELAQEAFEQSQKLNNAIKGAINAATR